MFANDPRYALDRVTEGFAARFDHGADDAALLERICSAYAAAQTYRKAAPWYEPTAWWQDVRKRRLAPVIEALRTRNIAALQGLYGNFFRDACSGGLIGVPYGMTTAYFGGGMTDRHRRIYLYDALHRLAYWMSETHDRYPLSVLRGPTIGNPFGVMMDGMLIATHADFRHACAHRVGRLLQRDDSHVIEIGGGFGGMAYYLLRDFPKVRYTNFDLPETIALASYYLIKAFPERTFALYGEACEEADVSLMPLWAMDDAKEKQADVTFSSHAMSDLAPQSADHYLETIERITRNQFLVIGVERPGQPFARLIEEKHPCFALLERRGLRWNAHRPEGAVEVELLYGLRERPVRGAGMQEKAAHVCG
jgi:hypothetical protein